MSFIKLFYDLELPEYLQQYMLLFLAFNHPYTSQDLFYNMQLSLKRFSSISSHLFNIKSCQFSFYSRSVWCDGVQLLPRVSNCFLQPKLWRLVLVYFCVFIVYILGVFAIITYYIWKFHCFINAVLLDIGNVYFLCYLILSLDSRPL